MRNFLKWLLLLAAALILLVVFLPNLFLRVPPPITSGTLPLPGLINTVNVYYDEYAVPHIYAENEHDLFLAAGYITASERLFQMDMVNRAIQGRLAEMNAGLLRSDRFLRTWGFHRIAKQMAVELDPDTRRIVQWACDGINLYIRDHIDNLPVEFKLAGHEPLLWSPEIACGYARMMAYDLKQSWYPEMVLGRLVDLFGESMAREVFPTYPDTKPFIVPQDVHQFSAMSDYLFQADQQLREALSLHIGGQGSNSWVISGSHTGTAKPILANDPHLSFTQPAKWYELHLVGGRFNVQGVCLAGIPLPVIGHNEHIAWGFTNVMTDDMDFYEEQVRPDNPDQYAYRGEWRDFIIHEEVINVKESEPVTLRIRETIHGVIINDIHPIAGEMENPIAMRWTGQDLSDELTGILKLNLARNWDDFSEAARLFGVPGQNVIYADQEGNIGWRPFVRIPIRKAGGSLLVMPGPSGEWDWQGTVPFEDMPFLFNPPAGMIATANNKTISDSFPYYISAYWEPPARIERIQEMLQATEIHSVESVEAIQQDVISPHARELVPFLISAYSEDEKPGLMDDQMRVALDRLGHWDYGMGIESVETTLFSFWFQELSRGIYADEMAQAGERFYEYFVTLNNVPIRNITHLLKQKTSRWFDNTETPEVVETRDDIIRQSFELAVAELRDRFGGDLSHWVWGDVHTLIHSHSLAKSGTLGKILNKWLSLNVGPFPSPGAMSTVNNGHYSMWRPFEQIIGPSMRRITDLSDLDNTHMILPTGQSGNPFNRHYDDQVELYNSGQYRRVPFSREAVESSAYSTLVLKP